MTGVKTNIVSSVEVNPSNFHDSPMMAPLVDSTDQRFEVAEIYADKAYQGERNPMMHKKRYKTRVMWAAPTAQAFRATYTVLVSSRRCMGLKKTTTWVS